MSRKHSFTNDSEPVVLTVPQAARFLQLSENSVYLLISQNAIPHTRFGKLIRIPRWGLLQFAARASGAPLPELAIRRDESAHHDQPETKEE
jgi:excisionase family DNA binding protein